MEIFFFYILFCILVGVLGNNRNIGFLGAFFLSLLLSPLIGLIFTLISKEKINSYQQQAAVQSILDGYRDEKIRNTSGRVNTVSLSEELNKLKEMKDNGLLDDDEFKKAKEKLLTINTNDTLTIEEKARLFDEKYKGK